MPLRSSPWLIEPPGPSPRDTLAETCSFQLRAVATPNQSQPGAGGRGGAGRAQGRREPLRSSRRNGHLGTEAGGRQTGRASSEQDRAPLTAECHRRAGARPGSRPLQTALRAKCMALRGHRGRRWDARPGSLGAGAALAPGAQQAVPQCLEPGKHLTWGRYHGKEAQAPSALTCQVGTPLPPSIFSLLVNAVMYFTNMC